MRSVKPVVREKFEGCARLAEHILNTEPPERDGMMFRKKFSDGAPKPSCGLVFFDGDNAARPLCRVEHRLLIKRLHTWYVEHDGLNATLGKRADRVKCRIAQGASRENRNLRIL